MLKRTSDSTFRYIIISARQCDTGGEIVSNFLTDNKIRSSVGTIASTSAQYSVVICEYTLDQFLMFVELQNF